MRRPTSFITFLALAFGLSWVYWGWMMATGRVSGLDATATHLPGLIGPALAALITTALYDGRPGLARLARRCLTIPKARGFASAAILSTPLLALLALALFAPTFPAWPEFFVYPGLPASLSPILGIGIVLIANGYGEEIGWRGWLQPALMTRFGPIGATLVLSAIWALWHLPLFVVNSSMTGMVGPALIGWLIGLVLGAAVLAHLVITTDSLLAAALWHTAFNYAVATQATQGLAAAVVSTAVMIWGLAVLWAWWRRT